MDGGGGGGGGGKSFLSAHRCPEVDLLPHQPPDTLIPPPVPDVKKEAADDIGCAGDSEGGGYLDVCSHRQEDEEEEEEDEREGSVSDWSEEDLSLHFSPSVLHLSEDNESDPESGFECVDVAMETQVRGQEGEGLRMVPKRQIQLKKRLADENLNPVQLVQVTTQGGSGEVQPRHEVLLRQHSVPSETYRVCRGPITGASPEPGLPRNQGYRGLIAGAGQGIQKNTDGHRDPRRLQKSFSLDETKAKMASCIIKSVLSKKMQVEQSIPTPSENHNTCKRPTTERKTSTSDGKTSTPDVKTSTSDGKTSTSEVKTSTSDGKTSTSYRKTSILDINASCEKDQVLQNLRSGAEGMVGVSGQAGGAFKTPVHMVRDMRSLVKNTYSLSFRDSLTDSGCLRKPTSFKGIGYDASPPPSYQQAVGVKGQKRPSVRSRGYVAKVAASLSQSEKALDAPSSSPHPPPLCSQGLSPSLGGSTQFSPPRSWSLRCVQTQPGPTSCQVYGYKGLIRCSSTQDRPSRPLQTSSGPLETRTSSGLPETRTSSGPPETRTSSGPPETRTSLGPPETRTGSSGHPEVRTGSEPLAAQPILCSVPALLPAPGSRDFLIDVIGSSLVPGHVPRHMVLDPASGRCFYVDAAPQPQRKILLDPETGQYVHVFLPPPSSTPNATVLPMHCTNPTFLPVTNPTPTFLTVANPTPTFLSVMPVPPGLTVSPLYTPPYLPFILHTPATNCAHSAP